MPTPSDATGPVTAYAASRNISIASEEPLGAGQDGTVWLTSRETAIKALNRERNYLNERDSYRLLTERSIDRIGIFDVPKLVDTDDELWIVEMGVVSPPYFLDFGKAYVNRSPPYTSEQLAESLYESEQLFEPADWPLVEAAVLDLKLSGIHYLDIKPANIRVRSEREEPPSTICDRVNDSWEQTIPEYERTARGKCVIHRYHRFANLGTQINRILEQAAYRFGRRRFKTSKIALQGDDRLFQALVSGCHVENAAVIAGVSERTAYRRLADPEFRNQLAQARQSLRESILARLADSGHDAIATLSALMHDSENEAIRLKAAKTLLDALLTIQRTESILPERANMSRYLVFESTALSNPNSVLTVKCNSLTNRFASLVQLKWISTGLLPLRSIKPVRATLVKRVRWSRPPEQLCESF